MLADTHVHLNSPDFETDLGEVLERARSAGVRRFLCPGYDLASSRSAVQLSQREEGIVAAVGVHPHDARHYDDATEEEFQRLLESGAAVAAGEMGLDYYYDNSPRDTQRQVLRRQLRLARHHAVPAVLHNRDSDEDMARILEEEAQGLRIVLHAFTGAPRLIEVGLQLKAYFGIGGFLTFKKHPLADCVRQLPRESLLLETDAPYLSPHPLRGRRNEPERVAIIARRLAELLEVDLEEISRLTSANYQRFLQGS